MLLPLLWSFGRSIGAEFLPEIKAKNLKTQRSRRGTAEDAEKTCLSREHIWFRRDIRAVRRDSHFEKKLVPR